MVVEEEETSLTAGREEGAVGRPDGFGLRGRDVPPRAYRQNDYNVRVRVNTYD